MKSSGTSSWNRSVMSHMKMRAGFRRRRIAASSRSFSRHSTLSRLAGR